MSLRSIVLDLKQRKFFLIVRLLSRLFSKMRWHDVTLGRCGRLDWNHE